MMRFYFVTGTFAECIKSCKRDAIKLMITIHNKFSSYRDVATYSGRQSIYIFCQLIRWRICAVSMLYIFLFRKKKNIYICGII